MTNLTKKELQHLKNVSQREYMYGDFDRDKAKNIDDPKPFNPAVSKYPKHNKRNASYYHRARYGGGEIKLSSELMAWERASNRQVPFLMSFLKSHPHSIGRIKAIPSLMRKTRKRYLKNIKDIAASTILTRNRQGAYRKAEEIQEQYHYDPSETDDYYLNPKGGVHYGLHYSLIGRHGQVMELQLKSHRMASLDKEVHPYYKHGGIPKRYKKKGARYFRMGA